MAKGVLSERSRNLIKVLLSDEKIRQKVYEDTKEFEKYKICTICNDGTIVLGKTRWRFWNRLLNCQDELPFESFALRVWDALVDLSSGFNNTAILEGLSREIVLSSVREREYDYVLTVYLTLLDTFVRMVLWLLNYLLRKIGGSRAHR